MMELTEDQQTAYEKIGQFLKEDSKYFTLTGSAGTGKTYLMQSLPNLLGKSQTMVVTAPTNKAVKVLEGFMKGSDVACCTIHKLLGLRVYKNKGKTTARRYKEYDPTEIADVKTVVLDEASMVDENLAKYIRQDAETWGRKYIFVGDKCQLPPLNSKSPYTEVFGYANKYNNVTLTKIVRQAAGNPIIKTATAIRDAIKNKQEPQFIGGMKDGVGVQLLSKVKFVRKMQEFFTSGESTQDVDYCRVIAWTNEATRKYNQAIRKFKGMPADQLFVPGDQAVINEAYEDGDFIINTGTEVVIDELEKGEHQTFPEIKVWFVMLVGLSNKSFQVVDPNCRGIYEDRVDWYRRTCGSTNDWRPYYKFKESFLDLRDPFSITSHKAQGSTFRNVFVDLADIYSNRVKSQADKCMYTAVTRASETVFIKY